MVRNKNFLVKFEDGKKREMSDYLLLYVCDKEEVGEEVYKTIYDLPKRGQRKILIIYRDPVYEGYETFGKGMYLSIFYCLCFVDEVSIHIAEKQETEERYPDLKWEEDFRIYNDMEGHWKEVDKQDNYDRVKVNALRWEVYIKDKEELIKRYFSVMVPHPKEGESFGLVWRIMLLGERRSTNQLE